MNSNTNEMLKGKLSSTWKQIIKKLLTLLNKLNNKLLNLPNNTQLFFKKEDFEKSDLQDLIDKYELLYLDPREGYER